MTSMGEPWTPRLADPKVNKANPFAHSTVSNSLFVVELGLNPPASGPFRVARQEPGSPGEAKAGAIFKVLPPTVLATCVDWPSPTLRSVSCPCAFASIVSLTGHPPHTSLPQSANPTQLTRLHFGVLSSEKTSLFISLQLHEECLLCAPRVFGPSFTPLTTECLPCSRPSTGDTAVNKTNKVPTFPELTF